MTLIRHKELFAGACMFLGAITAITVAEERRVGDWIGGPVADDIFNGCAYRQPLGNGIELAVYSTRNSAASLQLWFDPPRLRSGQILKFEMSIGDLDGQLTAGQSRNLQSAVIYFDAENGDSLVDVLTWSDTFKLKLDGKAYAIQIDKVDEMLRALADCVDGPGTAADHSVDVLDQALNEYAQRPVAAYVCGIAGHEMAGMPNINGDRSTDRFEFEVMEDASLRANGVSVIASGRVPEDRIVTVAYEVKRISMGIGGVQLPPTFSQEENAALNAAIGTMVGATLAGRQRLLIINIDTDLVLLGDLTPSGQLVNTATPDCYRTL